MSNPMLLAQSQAAKNPAKPPAKTQEQKLTKTTQAQLAAVGDNQPSPFLLFTSVGLAIALIALIVFAKIQMDKLKKQLRFEQFRAQEIKKRLDLALKTIHKMETNPDLINSREFNLDYLRMRMAEEVFHFAIVNQVKVKVKDKISQALRPTQAQQGVVGIASTTGRQIDEIFDVEYETGAVPKRARRVLFRIQIRLMKLPTQATSATISQILDCIETYLSPAEDHDTWQPTIQGRIVYMHWDQKAKPTPLLVLEQSNEGVNVSFRTSRQPPVPTPPPKPATVKKTTSKPTKQTKQTKPTKPTNKPYPSRYGSKS